MQTISNKLLTDFYHSKSWNVLEQRSRASGSAASSGVVKARNVWSPKGSGGYVDSLILRDADLNNDGDVTDFSDHHYVQPDANFNVTSITNRTGTVVERYNYDPYGTRTVLNTNFTVFGEGQLRDYGMIYDHQGGRHDEQTQLVHFRNRDLHTVLGRWTRQDPLGYVDGMNKLQAYISNPAKFTDARGLAVGHHIVPKEIWVALPDSPGKKLLDRLTTGRLDGGHHWDKPYKEYNAAVTELFDKW